MNWETSNQVKKISNLRRLWYPHFTICQSARVEEGRKPAVVSRFGPARQGVS